MTECDVIVDLQFGSTGKGLIAGFLAKMNGYDTVVNANMPNAGHTFIDDDGRTWVHKVLPNGIVSPEIKKVMIGPGSVFNPTRLVEEIRASKDLFGKTGATVFIHQDAMVLNESHRLSEAVSLSGISSTMQGSSAAMIDKIKRGEMGDYRAIKTFKTNQSFDNVPVVVVTNEEWINLLYDSDRILLEGAQGYSLSLNAGFWPYCTSRDCTPARFMSDCFIPLGMLRRVIGTARTYPIRVGNTPDGFSGDGYMDQHEVQWSEIGVEPETTTVTGRIRRVFTFSECQIAEAISVCQPNEVFLNFANYCEHEVGKLVTVIEKYQQIYVPGGGSVRYLGFGPKESDVRMRHFLNPCDYSDSEIELGWTP